MPILVVCTKCRKSFNVSEKFAGRTGPCPACKAPIKVPEKAVEVTVHAPAEFASGGRSITGQLITKPIARKAVRVKPAIVAAIVVGSLAVLIVTWVLGRADLFKNLWACGVGVLVISPPLVFAPYTFLREEELEPYRGRELWIRTGICALAYAILWAVFCYLLNEMGAELYLWAIFAPPVFLLGAGASLVTLDLDFGNAFFHFAFYALIVIVLRAAAGLGWIWAGIKF
jgi:hypothetical protein